METYNTINNSIQAAILNLNVAYRNIDAVISDYIFNSEELNIKRNLNNIRTMLKNISSLTDLTLDQFLYSEIENLDLTKAV